MVAVGGDQGRAPTKRSAYIVVLTLLVLTVVALWAAHGFQHHPVHHIIFPTIFAISGLSLVGILTRKMPLVVAERMFVVGSAAVLLPALILWSVNPSPSTHDISWALIAMIWFGPVFPLCFLTFGTRRGLRACLLAYIVILLTAGPRIGIDVLAGGHALPETGIMISLAGTFGIMIAFLWLLASRLERLVAARAAAESFAAQATTDVLTGLPNRRALDDELDRFVARSHRHAELLSVVLIDVDHFKDINDRFGHVVGDAALVEAARRLSGTIRKGDLLGRWGGEEFLLLAPHTDQVAACQLAERCRDALSGSPLDNVGRITASFGVATVDADDTPRSLLGHADQALYKAKAGGRNRVVAARLPL